MLVILASPLVDRREIVLLKAGIELQKKPPNLKPTPLSKLSLDNKEASGKRKLFVKNLSTLENRNK